MRMVGAGLIAMLLMSACVSGDADNDQPTPSPSPADEDAALEKIPSLAGLLRVNEIEDCMYRENIKPDSSTIASLGLLAWLVAHVEENRELDFSVPISSLRLLDDEGFSAAVDDLVPSVTAKDEETLKLISWALGLSPHGIDVNVFLEEGGEAELIAGLYNQETGEVIVRSKDPDRVSPRGILTLAHELAHAATDQALGLRPVEKVGTLDDAALAYDSAVEGDASLVEFRFLSRYSPPKAIEKGLTFQLGLEDRLEKFRTGGVPELLIDSVVFPYQWGFGFVCAIYKEEGWRGIDRMYEKDPPVTTAQIMFPQRYLAGEEAIKPRPLPKLDRPWKSISSGTFGAAHLKSLFEAPANIGSSALSKPVSRAASWAGGTYELWRSKDERVGTMAIGLVEHDRYPGVLCDSMREWYEASFPDSEITEATDTFASYADDSQSAVITCEGTEVRVGISPDGEIAATLAE